VTDEDRRLGHVSGTNQVAYPSVSTINFVKGDIIANGVTVALGVGGTLSATYMAFAGNTTNLVFDVTGYFTPDATGDTYHPSRPSVCSTPGTRTGSRAR